MFRSIPLIWLLPAAAALFPPAALAESLPVGSTEMPEIVITADPLGEVDAHLVQPVQVLTEEDLKTRDRRNIGETVSKELGVTSSDFGPAVGRPIIRGLAGSRVMVLENGISTMDVSNVSVDHGVPVESFLARQIEIMRGPATLLYGSGASGGVVNVVNDRLLREVPDELELDLSVQYETASDGITGNGQVNVGAGDFALHLDGMIRDTEDYDIPGFAELDPDDPEERGTLENSSTETENVAGGASWVGDRGFIGFAVSRFTNDYGIPGHHHHEEGEEEEGEEEGEEGGVRVDMEQTRYDLEAALDQPLAGIRRIKTRWGFNDYKHNEIEPEGEIATRFDNEELQGRLEVIHETLGAWDGVFGLQYRDKDFSAVGEESFVLPSELESIGLFILEKGDFGRWHFDAGARYEHQDSRAITGVRAEHDLFNLSGGANWDYTEGYQLGLSVTHAQRAPAIEELYADGPHLATTTFEIGNPDLRKEKSTNIDFYWRKTEGLLTLTANFFYNSIDRFIFREEQDLNGDGFADRVEEDFNGNVADILDAGEDEELLLVFLNQDDADFVGFELEGVLRVLDDWRGTMDLRLWGDFVNGERNGGVNLPRIAPSRVGAGLTWSRRSLSASLDYTRINEQDRTAPLEISTSGYDMLNVYAGYSFNVAGGEITLFARGTNLLDDEARRHTSFVKDQAPLPGRSGIFGIRTSF